MEDSGIVIEKLAKVYSRRGSQVQALKGIDLEVHSGEIFGLLGPNGAGKRRPSACARRAFGQHRVV